MTRPDFTGAAWHRSRACGDGHSCVEVARVGGSVGVRDSDGEGVVLAFGEIGWRMFIAGVLTGEFELLPYEQGNVGFGQPGGAGTQNRS
jgi:Domain of unknown function (DUF397)